MNRIFRKVRTKLLNNNKITKYLLYGFGEIILVVVGILIALNINNWNDSRKNKARSKYYIQNLQKEFITNQNRITQALSFHKRQLTNCGKVLSLISNEPVNYSLDSLHIGLLQIGWAWQPNFQNYVWSELLSTGQVGLVENDSLKNLITEYYSDIQEVMSLEIEWSTYNIKYREASGQIFEPNLRLAIGSVTGQFEILGSITESLITESEISYRLKKIENIGALLTDIMIVRRVGTIVLTRLEKKNLHIQHILSTELEKY